MQPKAAKKIGGMTPKKMTGGEFGAAETVEIADYTVTKQIDQESGRMKICVEAPGIGEVKKEPIPSVSDDTVNAVVGQQQGDAAATEGEGEGIESKGGKKKRKSSKKRKSMKKKGGMKRKSMKVKA